MTDDTARTLAQAPVPWDDVRQRRVLARVEAAVQERARARRRMRGLGVAAGVAAAAGVVLALALGKAPADEALTEPWVAATDPDRDRDGMQARALPSIPFAAWPELRLPDRSVAQLRYGARVDVDVQRDELVHLVQRSGQVRYEVAPDRTRAFVVDAAGVEVRVVGTIFTVTLADDAQRVAVEVERGLVEVDNGERVAELGPGDALSLDVVAAADDELVMLDTTPPEPTPRANRAAPAVETLLADADAARARGELPRAAAALSELVRRHSHDPRAYGAYFQLGKVERARGRHAAAAAAFASCWKRAPGGALAEDARAEAAVSWHAAGRDDKARAAAEGYLARHPGGTHQARMRSLLAELP
jgi:transmembrane sensor